MINSEGPEKARHNGESSRASRRKVVVIGLGMVGIAFIEKLMKLDAQTKQFDITVIGEEPHLAYNRVGLSTFFELKSVEDLYLNPQEWYNSQDGSFSYRTNTRATQIDPSSKTIHLSDASSISYDVLVLATGSDAILPSIPGCEATGVFVYRTISDLEKLRDYAALHSGSTAVTIGGGLLGLEAAKALDDMKQFGSVKILNRSKWVLSRQLDADAGGLVGETIKALGMEAVHEKRVKQVVVEEGQVVGVTFEDGQTMDCKCICFAIGVRPRDELGASAGIACAAGGGFIVNERLETSLPGVYAIGDCASWRDQTFGIIAPGIEMADVLSANLVSSTSSKLFDKPDMSTKLKLLGVDVASFGDFFADRDGPRDSERAKEVKALTYKDPFGSVYKKYLFTPDGKYLLGGMMIGDTGDYVKLNSMVKSGKELDVPPSRFILGSQSEDAADDLPDDAQICSCHNVTKGDIVEGVKSGTCKTIADVKSCTKAGTGCGGCMPLIQTIYSKTMAEMGQEVSNHLCSHIPYARADLYNVVAVKQLKSFADVMKACGKNPFSLGCELCKPAIASILSSLFNPHLMDKPVRELQDTNDRFLANIQRNGTFSVVPRVAGGEITPDKLIVIGSVAKKYGLYCKITGGQRIDMFGARKQDLLAIWEELVDGGLESGHAYAKALRTVKSCVGSNWCRFGIGDSVGMAIRLEERYKSIRAPHKVKGGVSGCVRECAEAQSKDFGLIATDKGFNIFVGGNGGAKPRHAELLATDVPEDMVVRILDRFFIFYIRTAEKLQRTARWIESLPGGLAYLKEVLLDDKLGICDDMERQMQSLVDSYYCEWKETLADPDRRRYFEQFGNTPESVEGVEIITEREQQRPADWPAEPASDDFKGHAWTSTSWQKLVKTTAFKTGPEQPVASVNVKRGDTQIALFRVKGRFYATQQMCPHKRAFVLSDGLVGEDDASGKYWVSCPLHKRNFDLNGGEAGSCSTDQALSIATFPAEERPDGWVHVKLPPVDELDAVLGTTKWKVKGGEAGKQVSMGGGCSSLKGLEW